jgi:hypothetical protein
VYLTGSVTRASFQTSTKFGNSRVPAPEWFPPAQPFVKESSEQMAPALPRGAEIGTFLRPQTHPDRAMRREWFTSGGPFQIIRGPEPNHGVLSVRRFLESHARAASADSNSRKWSPRLSSAAISLNLLLNRTLPGVHTTARRIL